MIRLYVDQNLSAGQTVALADAQAHYLGAVMRAAAGAEILLFNGRDGEWRARLDALGRGRAAAAVLERTRAQAAGPDLWLCFAPVKRAPIDAIAAKATELGVARLRPVVTRHTVAARVNIARMRAIAIEAAEQCGRLDVPEVAETVALAALIAGWPAGRHLMVCDEAGGRPVAEALRDAAAGPWAVLVGPEGGFARGELDDVVKLPFASRVGLGPRLLRADTAALAALACWQALVGDWRNPVRR
jgi:16S rRNA (uracil1498-N3)-methyltransferase